MKSKPEDAEIPARSEFSIQAAVSPPKLKF